MEVGQVDTEAECQIQPARTTSQVRTGTAPGKRDPTGLYSEKNAERRRLLARKKQRRLIPERRAARRKAIRDRERARKGEIIVATHNVDGKHGVGRAAEVLGGHRQACLDTNGLQETRRDGQYQLKGSLQASVTVRKIGVITKYTGICTAGNPINFNYKPHHYTTKPWPPA